MLWGHLLENPPQSIRKHTEYIYAIEFWTECIILKICCRKLHGVTDLTTCASRRPVQQQASESAQRAVWIRYAWRTVLSGTEASVTRDSGCCEDINC